MKAMMALVALILSGCATFEATDNVRPGSPRFFAGTRLDMAEITQNEGTLDHFRYYEMAPPSHPGIDLLPSFVADTILFPIVLFYSIGEPLLYLP